MIEEKLLAERVIDEVEKAVVGKREILTQIMTAILAGGHILIDDIPGTGKTTMALAFSTAMGLYANRVQFTPDVLPADLTGFTIYQKKTDEFTYQPGAVMCNLLLADEINRTSPKTQSALLEVMEEHQVTVDGVTRRTGDPFIVIATENPVGSAGTQLLPDSQLDRFMICVSMGYPTVEDEMEILRRSQELTSRQDTTVQPVLNAETLLSMQASVREIFVHDLIFRYMAELAKATRENEWIELGLSPRGSVALTAMSKACAFLKGRKYVIPADVAEVFPCVASHRIFLNIKAKVGHIQVSELLRQILETVPQPALKKRR
nr:MoxR family ATPase [uncultured Mediterraneibacter sp.]